MKARNFAPIVLTICACFVIVLDHGMVFASEQTSCAPSYPQGDSMPGTRVVFFTTSQTVEGAEAYLDGKCQGRIRREAPDRNAYSLMVVNVPLGVHAVMVRMTGYRDFQGSVNVMASDLPPERTAKVVVRFELSPEVPK